jgi:hypothetical protein
LKETRKGMWSPLPIVTKASTKREFWERGINHKKKGHQSYILANTNTKLNTNQKQTTTREQIQRSLANVTGSQMLNEGDKKHVPTNIWERGEGFGEREYVYPLSSISKPYFACDLNHMIKSEHLLSKKCFIPIFIQFNMGIDSLHWCPS